MKNFNKKYLQVFLILAGVFAMVQMTMQCSKIENLGDEEIIRPDSKLEEGSFVLNSRGSSIIPPIQLQYVYLFSPYEKDLTLISSDQDKLDYLSQKIDHFDHQLDSILEIHQLVTKTGNVFYLTPQFIEVCAGNIQQDLESFLLTASDVSGVTDDYINELLDFKQHCLAKLKELVSLGNSIGLIYSNDVFSSNFPENWVISSIDIESSNIDFHRDSFHYAVDTYQTFLEEVLNRTPEVSEQAIYLNFQEDIYPNLLSGDDQSSSAYWKELLENSSFKTISTNATNKFQEFFGHPVLTPYSSMLDGSIFHSDKDSKLSIVSFTEVLNDLGSMDMEKIQVLFFYSLFNWMAEAAKEKLSVYNFSVCLKSDQLMGGEFSLEQMTNFHEWVQNNFVNAKDKYELTVASNSSFETLNELITNYQNTNYKNIFNYPSNEYKLELYPFEIVIQKYLLNSTFIDFLYNDNGDFVGYIFQGGNSVLTSETKWVMTFSLDHLNDNIETIKTVINQSSSGVYKIRRPDGSIENLSQFQASDEKYLILYQY